MEDAGMQDTGRQETLLERLADYIDGSTAVGALVTVGSFAAGTADAVSDLDLFVITYPGRFEDAWKSRSDLHVTGVLVEWDLVPRPRGSVCGHCWLSPDLVLVEMVISDPDVGGRLAEPFKVVRGDTELVERFPRRNPIHLTEMAESNHPIDVAYDALKRAVREEAIPRPSGPESL